MAEVDLERLLAVVEANNRKQNRRWLAAGIVFGGLAVPGILMAADVTVPHTFVAGTPAVANQVNANFAALTTEATRVSNIVQGPGDATTANRVVNLAAPIADSDAATKGYVDAAANGGGGGLTLVGTTTCPTGWTTALTGTAMFTWSTNSPNPAFTANYACFGPGIKIVSNGAGSALSTFGTIMGNTTAWVANSDNNGGVSHAPCVICVK